MKIIIISLLSITLTSCVSSKYKIVETPNNFKNIEAGTKYTFYDLQDRKSSFTITSIDRDSIVGKTNRERIAISKKDISEIRRNKTGATVILAGFTAGVFIVGYAIVDGARAIAAGFGGE